MKKTNKIFAIMIAMFFILSMTASMILLPAVNAQYVPPNPQVTYAFISAEPTPIGVGQSISLNFGVDKVTLTTDGAYGDRFDNFTIIVTAPNKEVTDLTGFVADDTGFAHTTYVATMTGNYTFQLIYGGQYLTGANPPPGGWAGTTYAQYIGWYYEPSTSSVQAVEVTTTPATTIPFNPLPTSYWTRPINLNNNNWNMISGNWFGLNDLGNAGRGYNTTDNFDPYLQDAPSTCHVLWTLPLAPGGLIGGEYGNTENSNFYSTAQYECKFKCAVMDGVLYYTLTPGASSYYEGTTAINLRTGQTLWTKSESQMNGTLLGGWIYNYISPNQYGGESYIWTTLAVTGEGTVYSLYDAETGNYILQITGGVTCKWLTTVPDGAMIGYYVNTTNPNQYTLTCWNASRCILVGSPGSNPAYSADGWFWRPLGPTAIASGETIPWSDGIQWTAPIAMSISGVPIGIAPALGGIGDNTQLVTWTPLTDWDNWVIIGGYSIINGAQLFIVNQTLPTLTRESITEEGNGMYILFDDELATWTAYSDTTGAKLWTATAPNGPTFYNQISNYTPIVAYGCLYVSTFNGNVYAFNDTNGDLVWDYYAGSSGYNNVYGTWPLKVIELVAGGMIYLNGGHTYNPPLFRGANAICLNATTGAVVWQILSFAEANSATCAAADGEFLLPNSYDNQVYAYGMGPTKTTVNAPEVGVTTDTPVTITGTVTDLSPGSQQNAVAMNFPNGLPCVSDASMTQFMEAVYEQQPMPSNLTGVPVTISVTDSNHNTYAIGTTTTDPLTGTFGLTWKPIISGNYTVTATFGGTDAYYGSYSTSYFYAGSPGATAAPTASPPAGLATQNAVMYIGIAIIIVIIVGIAALAIIMLRKRP